MNESKALQKQEPTFALTVDQFEGQIKEMDQFVKKCLKPSTPGTTDGDYGVIPGCGPKPVLLQPGSDKLCRLCGLYPDFEITASTITESLIRYVVKCILKNRNGEFMASGHGSCNSAEFKWRRARRDASPYEQDNTLLKMARKRAYMAAVITATRLHHKFTQDIEDLRPNGAPEYQDAEIIDEPQQSSRASKFTVYENKMLAIKTAAELSDYQDEVRAEVRINLSKEDQTELGKRFRIRINQLMAAERDAGGAK